MDIQQLVNDLACQEQQLSQKAFLAPFVQNSRIRVRISGIVHTLTADARTQEGWGWFRARRNGTARWIKAATLAQVDDYLQCFPAFRWHLARPLRGTSWLAYPANTGDAQQRLGKCQTGVIHLVDQGAALETVIAHGDGGIFWFKGMDRQADPNLSASLRQALAHRLPATALHYPGLTPEQRIVYQLASPASVNPPVKGNQPNAQQRLVEALQMGGGTLRDFREQENSWVVEWYTPDGEWHHSVINKQDLTVISAGICLDGEDQRFDLQSLVGVVEQRPDWA